MSATNEPFTLAAVRSAMEAMAKLPKPEPPCEYVLNSETYQRLRDDPVFQDVPMGFGFGTLRIYCKPEQRAPAWIFSNHDTAMRYLEGQLTEQELVKMQNSAEPSASPSPQKLSNDQAEAQPPANPKT